MKQLAALRAQTGGGILATPEPHWFGRSSLLSGSWPSWLITASQFGEECHFSNGTMIDPSRGDLFILMSGCVNIYAEMLDSGSSGALVDFLGPGDLVARQRHTEFDFKYRVRGKATVLMIKQDRIEAFSLALKNLEAGLMASEMHIVGKFAQAAASLLLPDTERLLRIAGSLASHPVSFRSQKGMEVHATKEEIRMYAGLMRRQAARAWAELADAGVVVFDGYKRFFYNPATRS